MTDIYCRQTIVLPLVTVSVRRSSTERRRRQGTNVIGQAFDIDSRGHFIVRARVFIFTASAAKEEEKAQ